MNDISYFNDMLARFEEIFYHELSECSRPKVELVGIDYLKPKNIQGNSAESVVESCIRELKAGGLVEDMEYAIHGQGLLLKLTARGCVHMPKEVRLEQDGIEPYLCPIANMILEQIIEKVKYAGVYVGEMKIDHHKHECVIKCAIYENIGKIGKVSDWTKV